jgi:hypothetical protein
VWTHETGVGRPTPLFVSNHLANAAALDWRLTQSANSLQRQLLLLKREQPLLLRAFPLGDVLSDGDDSGHLALIIETRSGVPKNRSLAPVLGDDRVLEVLRLTASEDSLNFVDDQAANSLG